MYNNKQQHWVVTIAISKLSVHYDLSKYSIVHKENSPLVVFSCLFFVFFFSVFESALCFPFFLFFLELWDMQSKKHLSITFFYQCTGYTKNQNIIIFAVYFCRGDCLWFLFFFLWMGCELIDQCAFCLTTTKCAPFFSMAFVCLFNTFL